MYSNIIYVYIDLFADGIDKKRLSKYQYTKCLQLGNGTGVDKKVIADVSEGLEKHR